MNQKHVVSCFDGTLNGWNRQSPSSSHVRQSSLLQQFQQNLNRYQDENNRLSKQKYQHQQIRLPLLANVKSNVNLQPTKSNLSKWHRMQNQLNLKKIIPLRMKTIMIYNTNENQQQEDRTSKGLKNTINYNYGENKEKFRKKVVVKFERIKEIGQNCLQFSDDKFFKDATIIKQKSKSVKLHMFPK